MRILFITGSLFHTGGPQTWLWNLCRVLKERGHSVYILSWHRRPCLFRGKNIYIIPTCPLSFLDVVLLGVIPTLFFAAYEACKIIKRKRINIVHTDSIHYGLSAAIAKSILGTPFVTTIHGNYAVEIFNWFGGLRANAHHCAFKFAENMTIQGTDAITLPSNWIKNVLSTRFKGKKAVMIPNAVTIPSINESVLIIRKRLGLPLKRKIILTATNFNIPQKAVGIGLLIEAVPKILKNHPDTVFIVLGDGIHIDRFKRKARELPVINIVRGLRV